MNVRTSSAILFASILSPAASRRVFRAMLLAAAIAVASAPWAWAQTASVIKQTVDTAKVRALPGHLPFWAKPANSVGRVSGDAALAPMTLVLARSEQQEEALDKLLADQQDPASPEYHHWLTPEQMGERFGLSEQDIETVSGWLQSQNLHVSWVSPSRMFIGFTGTAGEVGRAFHTEFQTYKVNGEERISVSSDPMIPEALAPAIKAVRGLFTIEDRPLHYADVMQSDSPEMNAGSGTHFIAPADFATIYNLPGNLTGSGEIIGIVGRARTNPADFNNFKSLTGSTFTNPTEIVPTAYGGVDPGPAATTCTTSPCSAPGDQGEATLDVLRSGSVAPGATLWLVVASTASGGIDDDTQYLLNSNPLPQVITISFGACELAAGASGVNYWNAAFKQAAGEGISVFVASGDAGASGCDSYNAAPPSNPSANSPNYICSSSYATCLGGTEFADTSSPSTYWSSSNSSTLSSALSYIPEGGWNDPLNSSGATQAASSGGGVSTVIATPSWQTGTGVPSAKAGRYTPDIAFSSSAHDGYFACLAAGGGSCAVSNGSYSFEYFSGTSAAAPDMAGITALLDQKLGGSQGNLNPQLYSMAASVPAAFHDVTVASSGVSGCTLSTPSMCNNSIPSPTALTGGQAGFLVTTGYDEVTGLGSLNVTQFIDNYSSAAQAPAATTGTASAITATTATLAGTVNPEGADTHVWFLYGTSSTLSGATQTASQDLGSGTTALAASANLTGLTAGTQYYFQVVAQNATGTTNGAINSFTTSVAAQAPAATTGAASAIASTTATLAGTVNPEGADTHVWFLYGTSSTLSGATQTASQDLGSGTTALAASANLTGLTAGTQYYYQVVAQNATGTTDGAIVSFTTTAAAQAPVATTGAASAIASTTATLAGTVNPEGADTHVWFLYGTSSALTGATQTASVDLGSGTTATAASANLTGLTAGTKYYFEVVAQNATGTTDGAIASFTTTAAQAPVTTTGTATGITTTTASLAGTVNPEGADTHVWFLYGTSSTLSGATQTASQDLGSGTTATAASASLTGLTAGTQYYFQVVAQNATGTTNGAIVGFTTTAAQAPAATTGAVTGITTTTATLAGTVNPEGADTHVWFLYGTSSTLTGATQTASQDLGSGTTALAAGASLTGLTAGTQYYFQVVAQNATGTTNGAIASFTTTAAAAPAATTGAATAITTTTATLAGTVNPEGADTHAWFLYGTSSTLSGATQTASQDLGSVTTASPVGSSLTGLTAGTQYYFQMVAQNATGTTNGAIVSFTTTAAAQAPAATTGAATAITTTSATLAGTVNPEGADTHVWFLYGTSSTLSGATQTASVDAGSGTAAAAATANLTGLTAGTQYYFQVVAQNATGTTNGAINSFTTSVAAEAPVATTGAATAITTTTATLAGTVNPEGADTHVWFLYGTSSTLSGATQTASVDIGSGTTATAVNANLAGLSAATVYYFQVVGQNAAGMTNGAINSFKTTASSTGSFTITGASVTVTAGTTTGNTSTITLTPNGFSGSVVLTAAVTSSPANAVNLPTFSFGTTSPVTLNGSTNETATLTITTTAPQTLQCTADNRTQHGVPWYAGGGAALACMLLFGIPARRRNWRRMLGMIALLIALAGGMMACGGGGGQKTCSTPVIAGTTPGSYTVTVTGTSDTTIVTGTVALTVQ